MSWRFGEKDFENVHWLSSSVAEWRNPAYFPSPIYGEGGGDARVWGEGGKRGGVGGGWGGGGGERGGGGFFFFLFFFFFFVFFFCPTDTPSPSSPTSLWARGMMTC